MQRIWHYLFCLLLMGALGLGIGHYGREQEVSLLKEWLSTVPTVIEKPVVVLQFVRLPYEKVDAKISVDSVPTDTDYMEQIAHVPEARLPDVSMSFEKDVAYTEHLQHVCRVLRSINHDEQAVRVLARLELAQLRVAGPMGKYIQHLATSLLVRYCKDDGRLQHCAHDPTVQADIEKAIALLEHELEHKDGFELFGRVDFAPVQRKVQRNAYNEKLRTVLQSKYA